MTTLEERKKAERKIALFRSLISHTIGIIYIIAELVLGFKPDLKDR